MYIFAEMVAAVLPSMKSHDFYLNFLEHGGAWTAVLPDGDPLEKGWK